MRKWSIFARYNKNDIWGQKITFAPCDESFFLDSCCVYVKNFLNYFQMSKSANVKIFGQWGESSFLVLVTISEDAAIRFSMRLLWKIAYISRDETSHSRNDRLSSLDCNILFRHFVLGKYLILFTIKLIIVEVWVI